MDDINEAFGLPRTPSPVRIGVLNMERLGGVGNRTVPAEDIFASAGTVGAPRSERLDVLVKVPASGEGGNVSVGEVLVSGDNVPLSQDLQDQSNIAPDASSTSNNNNNSTRGSIREWLGKRELSPEPEAPSVKIMKMGDVSPNGQSVKKKIFYYSPSNGGVGDGLLPTVVKSKDNGGGSTSQGKKRRVKKSLRRINEDSRQQLLTSMFSPKIKTTPEAPGKAIKTENEEEGSKNIVDNEG